MRHEKQTVRPKSYTTAALLATLLGLGAGSANAVEVWTTITSAGPNEGVQHGTLSGVMGPTPITFSSSNAGTSAATNQLLHLSSVDPDGQYTHIWDNNATGVVPVTPPYTIAPNNANIYPASAVNAPSQVVIGAGGTNNLVTVQFGTAAAPVSVTNPVLLVYSVDRSSVLNLASTKQADGSNAAVAITAQNATGVFNPTALTFSNTRAAAAIGATLEGCSKEPNFPATVNKALLPSRACAVIQFTGNYNQLILRTNNNDGIGIQVGYNAPPPPVVSITCTPALLKDAANQESTCQITANGPVTANTVIPLTLPSTGSTRYTTDCPASVTIPTGATASPACKIIATANTTPGDGDVSATLDLVPAPAAAYPAYTIGTGTATVQIQNDDGAAAPAGANAVPTLQEWAVILLSGFLMAAAALGMRGRNQR